MNHPKKEECVMNVLLELLQTEWRGR